MSDREAPSTDFEARLEREKLAALMELAYGAGHEINNPLANIAARAQTLLQDEADPERRRKLQAIHRQAMRAHEMIADLMLFARPPKLERAETDLRQIVREVVDQHREVAAERAVEIVTEESATPIAVDVDATQLAVAVAAVVTNAIEAIGAGGHVTVIARQSTEGEVRSAELIVRDDGPGISEKVRRHLFDPFFSGREAGRGLGFGLSKCWRIVTDHGGSVVVNNLAGGGAEFTIMLPIDLAN
jgi:signal transduction histidine kinase